MNIIVPWTITIHTNAIFLKNSQWRQKMQQMLHSQQHQLEHQLLNNDFLKLLML